MLPGKQEEKKEQDDSSDQEFEMTSRRAPDGQSSSDENSEASRKRQEKIEEENFLATITDQYTSQIFRSPVFLMGKNGGSEIVELGTAKELQKTSNKLPTTGEAISGFVKYPHLNAVIDDYMRKNPTADRYPEYVREERTLAKATSVATSDNSLAVAAPKSPGKQGLFGHAAPVREINSSVFLPQVIAVKPNSHKSQMKVFSYGDMNAGKTALLNSCCVIAENSINSMGGSIINGIDFRKITHNDVKFQWWDTASQERYRELTLSNFRDTDAIIVMTSTSEHFANMMESLLAIPDNGAANYHYYGVQYSADGQISGLTRVLNNDNPEILPRVADFTLQGFGLEPISKELNMEQLQALSLSLLENIDVIARMLVAEVDVAVEPTTAQTLGRR